MQLGEAVSSKMIPGPLAAILNILLQVMKTTIDQNFFLFLHFKNKQL
jgi:hypothetical protein